MNTNNTNDPESSPQPEEIKPAAPKDMRALWQQKGGDALKGVIDSAQEWKGGGTDEAKTGKPMKAHPAEKEKQKTRGKGSDANAEPPDEDAILNECCYDGKMFYLANHTNEYIPLDRRSLECHLAEKRFEDLPRVINRIQRERHVRVQEGYAGKPSGFYSEGGNNYLILKGPTIINPEQGSWSMLDKVIRAIIGDDSVVGDRQMLIFLLWLKVAYEALVSGARTPGQALVLAGPAGCGKSLLIDLIVKILGGRRGQPHKYITGRTTFNGELLGTEVLVSDDDMGSTDIRSRRGVAAQYKNLGFAGEVSIEAKYGTPRSFSPLWRLVIAANDEPESLLVLPPLSTDMVDKISLIQCHKRQLPMPSHTPELKKLFFDTLVSEIPAMLFELLEMKIPEELEDSRCAVTFFHHPALLTSLLELAPENSLLYLIDEALPLSKLTLGFLRPWEGTAAELRRELFEHCANKRDVEKLLPSIPTTGTYLGRLANSGTRVERLKLLNGTQRWRIHPTICEKDRIKLSRLERIARMEAEAVTEADIDNAEFFWAHFVR